MTAGFDIDVRPDIRGTIRYMNRVQRRVVPRATVMGLNKTLNNVEVQTRKTLAKEMGVPQSRIRKGMFKIKARLSKLTATLTGKGRPMNLIRFKARQTKKGVTAAPWGKRRLYKGAFIANQGRTVFARRYKNGKRAGRLPIRALWGPSIPKTMLERHVRQAMKAVAASRFGINFNQAMKYLLAKETL